MNLSDGPIIDEDGTIHELRLHEGSEYLRVYEYRIIGTTDKHPGRKFGKPVLRLANTDENRQMLYQIIPSLRPQTHAAAA